METKYPAHEALAEYLKLVPDSHYIRATCLNQLGEENYTHKWQMSSPQMLITEYQSLKAKADLVEEVVKALRTCKYEDTMTGAHFWYDFDLVEEALTKANKLTNGE